MATPPSSDLRRRLLASLRNTLQADARVVAACETGYAAYGHVDDWSAIELQVVVADGAVEPILAVIERAIEAVVPIAQQVRTCAPLPHPPPLPWLEVRPCPRTVFRLDNFGVLLLVDCELVPRDDLTRLGEIARHRRFSPWFDREGLLASRASEIGTLRETLHTVIAQVRERYEMFAALPKHEVRRGNAVDASQYYRGLLLRPLVTLYRVRYCPHRFDCDMRYLRLDLPARAYRTIRSLTFVANLDDLSRSVEMAKREIDRLLAEIDVDKLDLLPDWLPPESGTASEDK